MEIDAEFEFLDFNCCCLRYRLIVYSYFFLELVDLIGENVLLVLGI